MYAVVRWHKADDPALLRYSAVQLDDSVRSATDVTPVGEYETWSTSRRMAEWYNKRDAENGIATHYV